MNDKQREEWVVVAQFNALDMGLAADMAVSKLQGSGIPAMRFPTAAVSALAGRVPAVEWIRVLVPPDQADAAREILTDATGAGQEGQEQS